MRNETPSTHPLPPTYTHTRTHTQPHTPPLRYDVQMPKYHGVTPLMNASQHNRVGCVRLLLKRKADANATMRVSMYWVREESAELQLECGDVTGL